MKVAPDKDAAPSGLHHFSLAELMVGTLTLAVLLGVMRVALHDDFYVLFAVTMAAMIGLIIVLAIMGKVRLVPMLVVVSVLGLAFAYVGNPGFSARDFDPCRFHLPQIAAALIAYNGDHDCLPPAYIVDANGKPMHSWRVLILPYLGQQKLYDEYRFDEPWDGPNNKKLHDRIVDSYRCPQDHPNRWSTAATQTSYVVITGPGTAFPGGRPRISIADVANGDGASNTILVAEVHSSGIHWMEPRDLDFATMDIQINGKRGASISSKHAGGAMVAVVDGSVRFLDDQTPPNVVKGLITYRGREQLPANLAVPEDESP